MLVIQVKGSLYFDLNAREVNIIPAGSNIKQFGRALLIFID